MIFFRQVSVPEVGPLNDAFCAAVFLVMALCVAGCNQEAGRYMASPPPEHRLYGEWSITASSLENASTMAGMEDGAKIFPWAELNLRSDGSFTARIPIVKNVDSYGEIAHATNGQWEMKTENPVFGAPPDKAALVELKVKTGESSYVFVRMFIMKRGKKDLILWLPIGDLDRCQYQEYDQEGDREALASPSE
jgi:hypothetical protein